MCFVLRIQKLLSPSLRGLTSGKASICWLGPVSPTYHVDIRRTLSTHSSLSLSSLRLGFSGWQASCPQSLSLEASPIQLRTSLEFPGHEHQVLWCLLHPRSQDVHTPSSHAPHGHRHTHTKGAPLPTPRDFLLLMRSVGPHSRLTGSDH